MTTSRITRGFHRLALFLAGVPLLAGVATSVMLAMEHANRAQRTHEQLLCAHGKIQEADKLLAKRKSGKTITFEQAWQLKPRRDTLSRPPKDNRLLSDEKIGIAAENQQRLEENPFWLLFAPSDAALNLKQIGCSTWEYDTVSFGDARNPPKFNWLSVFAPPAAVGLAITLALTLSVYGLVRAIGWVIDGFAAS